MTQIKRTKYLFFLVDEAPVLDIALLLRGEVSLGSQRQLYAISVLRGREYSISLDDLRSLFALPSAEWVAADKWDGDPETLSAFVEHGLVVSDDDDPALAELRQRDEALSSTQWNIYAALYHFMARWGDVDVRAQLPAAPEDWEELLAQNAEAIEAQIGQHGAPPSNFHRVAASGRHELPLVPREDGLFGVLAKRRTTRAFRADVPLAREHLAQILYSVFGCQGYLPVFGDVWALKKTSPSGGSLHPTEVYPLVLNVDGVPAGVHHYNIESHALDLLIPLEAERARELATELTAGQSFARDAQALFLMTSRFYRSFWKYRKQPRAYSVLLMDVGHLSQTFYLVCAELGLGAFVTAAINSENIERTLGVNGFLEGAMAICGCGAPAETNLRDPRFRPYVPRKPPR